MLRRGFVGGGGVIAVTAEAESDDLIIEPPAFSSQLAGADPRRTRGVAGDHA
ncbi:MAG TPA: hypothetical protein PKJ41_02485 [Bryobacteraceae bacterium]|nr:hypothetical protein [Bryobacteraceae bacterium]HPT28388.1 hypothetical protein [Bryobacteraceae bacterium]